MSLMRWWRLSLALAACALWPATAALAAGELQVLAHFDRQRTGFDARGPLAAAPDGSFVGVSVWGGAKNGGTLFRVTPKGRIQVLHAFDPKGPTGGTPIGTPLATSDGGWVGTTCEGGPRNLGGVWRASADGRVRMLRWFSEGQRRGPACPHAGLMRAADGRLYGTSQVGGAYGEGTVYSLLDDGSDLRVEHNFHGGAGDGAGPTAPLVQASDGALYGTTTRGGPADFGTVFRLQPGGAAQVLVFLDQPGGTGPWGPVMQAPDGRLYGITQVYGPDPFDADRGTAFRLEADGRYTVVSAFGDTADSPRVSSAGFVAAPDGSLWSSSSWGGAAYQGSLFRVWPDGRRETLHSFTGGDGSSPAGAPLPAGDGWWIGTTSSGGRYGAGVVYRFRLRP